MFSKIFGYSLGWWLAACVWIKIDTIKNEKRNKKMYEASDYLKKNEKKGQLYCMQNDKICEKLLKEYQKGPINVSCEDWHDIVVPLSKK